ncbi:MAG: hypothetical protein ACU84H_01060 [Gammaproteobacteria bacterium]
MYKILMILFLVFSVVTAPALAEKPGWAGQGQSSEEKMKTDKSAIEGMMDNSEKEKKEKIKTEKEKKLKKEHDELRGLEKQRATKSVEMQKELDKGSEQGQEARSKRRKWWKFWGG